MVACVAAIAAVPICATSVVKMAKAAMSRNHWPPIGAPVRRNRRMARASGRTGRVAKRSATCRRERAIASTATPTHSEIEVATPAPAIPQAGSPSFPNTSP